MYLVMVTSNTAIFVVGTRQMCEIWNAKRSNYHRYRLPSSGIRCWSWPITEPVALAVGGRWWSMWCSWCSSTQRCSRMTEIPKMTRSCRRYAKAISSSTICTITTKCNRRHYISHRNNSLKRINIIWPTRRSWFWPRLQRWHRSWLNTIHWTVMTFSPSTPPVIMIMLLLMMMMIMIVKINCYDADDDSGNDSTV